MIWTTHTHKKGKQLTNFRFLAQIRQRTIFSIMKTNDLKIYIKFHSMWKRIQWTKKKLPNLFVTVDSASSCCACGSEMQYHNVCLVCFARAKKFVSKFGIISQGFSCMEILIWTVYTWKLSRLSENIHLVCLLRCFCCCYCHFSVYVFHGVKSMISTILFNLKHMNRTDFRSHFHTSIQTPQITQYTNSLDVIVEIYKCQK